MRSALFAALAWFMLGACAALGQPPPVPQAVVLLSIDGLRPDYVLEADRHHLKIPNLRRLMSDGAWASGVTGVLPTVTYPSHTTMITGVSAARHGVFSNTTFDPLKKNLGGWYWYAEDIRATTLWEAVRAAGGEVVSVHWPVSVGAPVRWNLPQVWRAETPDDRKLVRALSTPGLVDEVEKASGRYPEGSDETLAGDRGRAAAGAWLLTAKKPKFATLYLTALDHEQHAHGPFSREAFETLEGIDTLVGRIRAAAGPDAVLCVVSDHGFLPINKEAHLNILLVKAGLIELNERGSVVDWQASVWASGGTAAVMAKTPEASAKARAVLANAEGVARVVEGEELRVFSGYPEAAFVLAAAHGYAFGGDATGAAIRTSGSRGTHGYLPDDPDMNSSLFVAGPGVNRKGSLGRIDMRDIAPTLAALLGVALPEADGKNLFGR